MLLISAPASFYSLLTPFAFSFLLLLRPGPLAAILFSDGAMFCGLSFGEEVHHPSTSSTSSSSSPPLSTVSQGHPLKGAEQRLAVICRCYSIVTGQSGPLAAVLNNASAFKKGEAVISPVCVFVRVFFNVISIGV